MYKLGWKSGPKGMIRTDNDIIMDKEGSRSWWEDIKKVKEKKRA